jgi:hypothetical protein
MLPLRSLQCVRGFYTWPLAFYGLLLLGQAVALMPRAGMFRSLGAVPLIFLSHVLYGFGFWRGLFTKLNRGENKPRFEVALENVPR